MVYSRLARLLSLVFLLTGTGAASAKGLPNFDIQTGERGTTLQALPVAPGAAAPRAAAARRMAGLKIRYDSLTGNASRVSRPGGTVTGPSALAPRQVAQGFLLGRPDLFQQKAADAAYLYVPRQYRSAGLGVEHVWLGQQFGGIPVFKSETLFHISGRGEILSVSGSPVPNLRSTITSAAPKISAAEALSRAAGYAGMAPARLAGALQAPQGARRAVVFGRGAEFTRPPVVQLIYFPTGKGQTSLAWETTLWQTRSTDVYHILVDAANGRLLYRKNYTSHASGQVYDKGAPQDGTPYLGSIPPLLARAVRPFGGDDLFDGSPLFAAGDAHRDWWAGNPATSTVSNNTVAGTARSGQETVITPATSAAGDFSFPLNLGQDPSAYQSAASTNLFYWVNRAHDVWYQFGFNEAAGNFQTNNFGLGGQGGDPVLAHAQFGADVDDPFLRDNADMATPPDGDSGIMRMFVFTETNPLRDGDLDSEVIVHEYGHGVTNRIIGNGNGLTGFQGGAMGEGWSDFQALMVLAESADNVNSNYPVGGYVVNDFIHGIRSQPYSVNPAVFTHTYAEISGYSDFGPEVHDAGEIMCNTLFQTFVLFANRLGFSPGRHRLMQLFIDALMLCPDEPTFLDFRDGLLLADQRRFAGADLDDIWAAFASRGMGFSASTTDPDDINPVEAFDIPVPTFSVSGHVTNGGQPVDGAEVFFAVPGTEVITHSATPGLAIPDDQPIGIASNLSVPETGTLNTLTVHVDITHSFPGDLVISLAHPDGTQVVLFNRGITPGPNLHRTFSTNAFKGKPIAGTWRLRVSDEDTLDVGTLDSWTLNVGRSSIINEGSPTNSQGFYTFSGLPAGDYPTLCFLGNVRFKPTDRVVTIIDADVTGSDFSFDSFFNISGKITLNGMGVDGVRVAAGGMTARTNSSGNYSFIEMPAGTYTVTPTKPGYTFSTSNPTVTLGPSATVDFTSTATLSSVHGTVTLDGLGLSGVLVTAGGQSVTTDGSGNYTVSGLPPGNYTVVATKNGYNIASIGSPNVTLPPNATVNFNATVTTYIISGLVLESGIGRSGVSVSAGGKTVTTNNLGAYVISGLGPGTYDVSASLTNYTVTTSTPTVMLGPSATVNFTAVPITFSISGKVTFNGDGLSGAAMSVGLQTVTTDANGNYAFPRLTPGTYTVSGAKAGLVLTSPTPTVTIGPNAKVDFTAAPITFSITGSVKTLDGNGLVGVTVSTGGISTVTNPSGSYVLSGLAPGSHTVTATKSGFTIVSTTPTVTLGPDARVDFTATTATFSISGAVTEQGGAGKSGVSVSAGGKTVMTNASGSYVISGLAPGSYTILTSLPGYTISPSMPTVTVGPDATQNFTAIPITFSISGAVKRNGNGVSGVNVAAGGKSTTTDGNGNYVLLGLLPGTYTVTASKSGFILSTSTPSVTLGPSATVNFNATLATFNIRGTVTEGGVGKSGVTVSAGGQSTVTDGFGAYTLSNLLPGSYTVTATLAEYTITAPNPGVTLGPDATVNFTATRVTYSISGTVREGSAGVAGATISAGGKTATTGSNGAYTLDGLVSGSYTVTASKSGFTLLGATTRSVSLGPNATAVDFSGTSLPVVTSFMVASSPVRGKKTVKGTVVLNKPVPAKATVSVTSSSPAITIKATIAIKKGASSGAFSFKTAKVTVATPVTLKFTLNGVTYQGQVTVQP